MSVLVTFNGSGYLIPTSGETGWATPVTGLLQDLGSNAVTPTSTQSLSNKTLTAALVTADPVTGLGVASKQYVDNSITSNNASFLQLNGGTMAGHIRMNSTEPAVPGDAATNNLFSIEHTVDNGGHVSFNTYLNNSSVWKTRSTGYTGQIWLSGTGVMNAQVAASTTAGASQGSVTGTLTLDQTGKLTVNGKMQAGQAILAVAAGNPTVTCYNTGGGQAMGMWQNATALNFGNTDGSGTPTVQRAALDTSSNFSANGSISAGVNVIANNAVFPNNTSNGGYYFTSDATYNYTIHQAGGGWQERWNRSNGVHSWWNSIVGTTFYIDGSGNTIATGASYATAYPGPSDMRLKEEIADFHAGLAELLRVKPSSWKYTGNLDDKRRHVGIHAQHLQDVIPEAVVRMPHTEDSAHDVTDALGVDPAPVLAAVVNALHEIDARLKRLEEKAGL